MYLVGILHVCRAVYKHDPPTINKSFEYLDADAHFPCLYVHCQGPLLRNHLPYTPANSTPSHMYTPPQSSLNLPFHIIIGGVFSCRSGRVHIYPATLPAHKLLGPQMVHALMASPTTLTFLQTRLCPQKSQKYGMQQQPGLQTSPY